MKFMADENVDKPIVERLEKNGHDVLYVMEGNIKSSLGRLFEKKEGTGVKG